MKRPRKRLEHRRAKPKAAPDSSAPSETSEISADISDEVAEKPIVGTLVRQPHGGALKYGGSNLGAGRPPDAQREMFRRLACLPEAQEFLEKILKGENFVHKGAFVLVDGDLYMRALAWVNERGYGRVSPEAEVNPQQRPPLTIRLVHEPPAFNERATPNGKGY